MATVLKYRFAMRRRSAAEWTAVNEVLYNSEWGLETDDADVASRLKIGDGVRAWNDLPYLTTDQIPEGLNKYFTKQRVADSLASGTGIQLEVDADGNTTISVLTETDGVLLTDGAGVQLTDGAGVELTDATVPLSVSSFKGRAGVVVPVAGDYTTDMVPEAATPSNLWFTFNRVRATLLTGLAAGANVAIAATDTILGALAKLQAQITAVSTQGWPPFTLATLPDPAAWQYRQIVVTNSADGPMPCWSDGTNWLRIQDNTVVS